MKKSSIFPESEVEFLLPVSCDNSDSRLIMDMNCSLTDGWARESKVQSFFFAKQTGAVTTVFFSVHSQNSLLIPEFACFWSEVLIFSKYRNHFPIRKIAMEMHTPNISSLRHSRSSTTSEKAQNSHEWRQHNPIKGFTVEGFADF